MPNTKVAKRAQLVVVAVAVICPHCHEPCPEPSAGSDMWEPQQIEDRRGKPGTCSACGKAYYIPSVVASVKMP
jgi:hypothetical protein